MSLEEIKAMVAKLSREDQNRVLAFACYLNLTVEERAEMRIELREALVSENFGRWRSAGEIRERLRDVDDAESRRRIELAVV